MNDAPRPHMSTKLIGNRIPHDYDLALACPKSAYEAKPGWLINYNGPVISCVAQEFPKNSRAFALLALAKSCNRMETFPWGCGWTGWIQWTRSAGPFQGNLGSQMLQLWAPSPASSYGQISKQWFNVWSNERPAKSACWNKTKLEYTQLYILIHILIHIIWM